MTGEQIEIVGWRYEVYSEMLDTWTPITTFTRTAPEIRERVGQMRRLTPLVAYDDITAHSAKRQMNNMAETDSRIHTAADRDRRKHAVAAARNGHTEHRDDHA